MTSTHTNRWKLKLSYWKQVSQTSERELTVLDFNKLLAAIFMLITTYGEQCTRIAKAAHFIRLIFVESNWGFCWVIRHRQFFYRILFVNSTHRKFQIEKVWSKWAAFNLSVILHSISELVSFPERRIAQLINIALIILHLDLLVAICHRHFVFFRVLATTYWNEQFQKVSSKQAAIRFVNSIVQFTL